MSRVDKKFIACALAHNYKVSTTDNDLIDFLQQEFSKTNVAALNLINKWLRNRLIDWNEQRQSIIAECNTYQSRNGTGAHATLKKQNAIPDPGHSCAKKAFLCNCKDVNPLFLPFLLY